MLKFTIKNFSLQVYLIHIYKMFLNALFSFTFLHKESISILTAYIFTQNPFIQNFKFTNKNLV